jgi:hypothetical protein
MYHTLGDFQSKADAVVPCTKTGVPILSELLKEPPLLVLNAAH